MGLHVRGWETNGPTGTEASVGSVLSMRAEKESDGVRHKGINFSTSEELMMLI